MDRIPVCRVGPFGYERTSHPTLTSGFDRTFNPRAPYLVCDPRILPKGLGYWFRRLSSVPIFEKHGCRTFAGKGHRVVSPQAFLEFVGDHVPQEDFLDMPILTGEELHDVAMTKKIHSWWIGLLGLE